ncbi:MAG: RusA family crossover junction endodeoxyribonuclease [Phycisphaeraceae bacterium]|nr:RusA family crossover junction endodeoxyribonuclease [Phycisphaeraceae bacterium]
MIRIELPWPPSVNRYWRSIPLRRGYRVVLSREGRAYRRDVCARLAAHRWSLAGRLHVRVTLCAPTRRPIDLDNRLKGLLDAMQHAGVYDDDGQIDRIEVERGEVIEGGSALVEITEVIA